MATTKKALAMAEELVSELKQRQSALAVALSYDADGSPLLRPLVEIPLELSLELRGTAHRSGRHLEDSIRPRAWPAARASRVFRSTGRA